MSKKNILLIGIGGTGSNAVDLLYQKIQTLGQKNDNLIRAIVFDTDTGDLERISAATVIPLADPRSLGTVIKDLKKEYLSWFPCKENYYSQEMYRGASQWRMKSFLSFVNLMNDPVRKQKLHDAVEEIFDRHDNNTVYEVYTVASIAGGTGSGSFLPITMYVKKYIEEQMGKSVNVTAMLACPDIYASKISGGQVTKVYANAYAILRELNAINQVTHGYNNPALNPRKHAPIHMRIGAKNDPYIGLLFDADDPRFWTSSASPFEQIYLLDRQPGLTSVEAHDNILANSLYTILCTMVGDASASARSNDAEQNSRTENINAIYAGISTSELFYPLEANVNYIANRLAEESSNGEWLTIHEATEQVILEDERVARETRQPYILGKGEYGRKLLAEVANQEKNDTEAYRIVDRGYYNVRTVEQDGMRINKKDDRVELFFRRLMAGLEANLQSNDRTEASITSLGMVSKYRAFASAQDRESAFSEVKSIADQCYLMLQEYYKGQIDRIRNTRRSAVDDILSLADDKDNERSAEFSLVANLLKKDGKFVHPVAAIAILCKFQQMLLEKLPRGYQVRFPDTTTFRDPELPDDYLSVSGGNNKKSRYAAQGADRFRDLCRDGDWYTDGKNRSNVEEDSKLLKKDALDCYDSLKVGLLADYKFLVLTEVEKRVDLLIQNYRRFFSQFKKEKEDLHSRTLNALHVCTRNEDRIFIGASVEDKKAAFEQYTLNSAGANDAGEIEKADDMVGGSVFTMVHAMAGDEAGTNRSKNASMSKLLDAMIDSYRSKVHDSRYYREESEKSIFQCMCDAVQGDADDKLKVVNKKLKEVFDNAKPSLQVEDGQTRTVIMFSECVADYLVHHTEDFGLRDGNKKSVAEQFLQKAGLGSAKLALTKDDPFVGNGAANRILYVTREVVNVDPIKVDKINELSASPVYYRNYLHSLAIMHEQNTDMSNPHLQLGWEKRGAMPAINPALEEENSKKLAKALLYGIMAGELTYARMVRSDKYMFYYNNDGNDCSIFDADDKPVTKSNINGLMYFLRQHEELVDAWSEEYDRMVEREMQKLPLMSESTQTLNQSITTSDFIRKLREDLFAVAGKNKPEEFAGMGVISFAFLLKRTEEASYDYDDAEKVLAVGYDTLDAFCRFRVNKQNENDFIDVYLWQLEKFCTALFNDRSDKSVLSMKPEEREDYVARTLRWTNDCGYFKAYEVGRNVQRILDKEKDIRRWHSKAIGAAVPADVSEDEADAE